MPEERRQGKGNIRVRGITYITVYLFIVTTEQQIQQIYFEYVYIYIKKNNLRILNLYNFKNLTNYNLCFFSFPHCIQIYLYVEGGKEGA